MNLSLFILHISLFINSHIKIYPLTFPIKDQRQGTLCNGFLFEQQSQELRI
jgi:hypothetical protein